MSLIEAKKKYKEVTKKGAHHSWDEETILAKLAALSDNDEETPPVHIDSPGGEVSPEKKALKPVNESLFIPKVNDAPARNVAQKDWTQQDTKDYREAYKDRLQKAMKKLK